MMFYSSLTERRFLSRAFLFYKTPLSETEVKGASLSGCNMLYTNLAAHCAPDMKLNHPNHEFFTFGGKVMKIQPIAEVKEIAQP